MVAGVVFHRPQVQWAPGYGTLPLAELPGQALGSGGNVSPGHREGHGMPLQPVGLVRPTLEYPPCTTCPATTSQMQAVPSIAISGLLIPGISLESCQLTGFMRPAIVSC